MKALWFGLKNLGILVLALFYTLPLIPWILSSFSAGWRWPEVLPHAYDLRVWTYVMSEGAGTWEAIRLSLEIAFLVTVLNLLVGLPAAYALARIRFRGKGLIEVLLYAPIFVPPFVSTMGLHLTFLQMGLTESVRGIVLAHLVPTLPYMVRALIVSFETLGSQWEEQARVLGAGAWQRFWNISLPHILPGVLAGASLSVLISLSQYLITLIIGGGQVLTLPLLMFPFISGGDQAIGSAYALLFSAMAGLALWGMNDLLKRYYGKRIRLHF